VLQVLVKCEGPACGRASSFSYYFYFNESGETKMPTLADLFLACKRLGLFALAVFALEF
jgi:hypothetical protein